MGWSFRIAQVGGIAVRIHLTFLLLLAFLAVVFYRSGGAQAAFEGVVFILLLFGCVLLHEFGHALAAAHYGIRTPDITLLPIGGLARLERMPDKPYQEIIVALAGPLVNVVIAGALLVVMGGRGDFERLQQMQQADIDLVISLFSVNVVLVLFNMIPAFPMDGGRVLRALLATRMSYARATQIAANVGQAIAIGFGVLGLFPQTMNPILILIAVFIWFGASQEAAVAQMKDVAAGMPVSSAMITTFETLGEGATLGDAVDMLLDTSQHEFPVVDSQGHILGLLTRREMLRAIKHSNLDTPVAEVMERDLPTVHPNQSFERAFHTMNSSGSPALPVVDSEDRLVGLITTENIGEMMMVNAALGKDATPSWRMRRV